MVVHVAGFFLFLFLFLNFVRKFDSMGCTLTQGGAIICKSRLALLLRMTGLSRVYMLLVCYNYQRGL